MGDEIDVDDDVDPIVKEENHAIDLPETIENSLERAVDAGNHVGDVVTANFLSLNPRAQIAVVHALNKAMGENKASDCEVSTECTVDSEDPLISSTLSSDTQSGATDNYEETFVHVSRENGGWNIDKEL